MNELSIQTYQSGEIVIYQPDENVRLDVRLEEDTVWLSQQQIADLFGTKRPAITKHLNNIFREGELEKDAVSSILEHTAADGKTYKTQFYNLDAILSVGYRVNSINATRFRIWANKVLKEYLLKGYAINTRLNLLEDRFECKIQQHERLLQEHQRQIEFFIRTNQPPIEGIFFEGQIFDAYRFVEGLVQQAKMSIVLVDNYVDASVIDTLGQGRGGIDVTIYTEHVTAAISHAVELYNAQHPDHEVEVRACASRFHDHFLIIDDDVYHLGASVKDLGRRLFAFTRLGLDKSLILQQV